MAIDREENLTLLAQHPLFDNLSPEQLTVLAKYVRSVYLSENVVLFHEGDEGDEFFFIVKGKLEVRKLDTLGRPVPLLTLLPGRIFGEMAIVDGFQRSASVRTLTDVTLIALSTDDYERLSETSPAIALEIMRNVARLLSQYLRNTSGMLVDRRSAA